MLSGGIGQLVFLPSSPAVFRSKMIHDGAFVSKGNLSNHAVLMNRGIVFGNPT